MFDKESGRMIELNINENFTAESILELKNKSEQNGSQLVRHEKYTKNDYETFLKNSTIKNN
jgi:hypothetical protein